MPVDPIQSKIAKAGTPDAQLAARLSDVERRLSNLERSRPGIQVVAGTPSGSPRAGTPVVDSSAVRLWLYVNGAWHYSPLT